MAFEGGVTYPKWLPAKAAPKVKNGWMWTDSAGEDALYPKELGAPVLERTSTPQVHEKDGGTPIDDQHCNALPLASHGEPHSAPATATLQVTIGTTGGKHWAEVELPDGLLRVQGRGYGSPLPFLARAMTEKGIPPSQRLNVVTQTGTVSFANQPLSWWAERTVVESEARGAHFAFHSPFGGSL